MENAKKIWMIGDSAPMRRNKRDIIESDDRFRAVTSGRTRQFFGFRKDQEKEREETGRIVEAARQQRNAKNGKTVVAIASSTGGPRALQSVIPLLPRELDAPVLLVQHMPKAFTASLAERLNHLSKVTVTEAKDGDVLENGHVYIAQGGLHMKVAEDAQKRAVIRYTDEPAREGVKPCANYLYESLAQSGYETVICVVMTGMGADGTQGIDFLKKQKKTHVIVQNRETCVVYGMPKSVVSGGLSDQEVPLENIAQEIIMNVGVR